MKRGSLLYLIVLLVVGLGIAGVLQLGGLFGKFGQPWGIGEMTAGILLGALALRTADAGSSYLLGGVKCSLHDEWRQGQVAKRGAEELDRIEGAVKAAVHRLRKR